MSPSHTPIDSVLSFLTLSPFMRFINHVKGTTSHNILWYDCMILLLLLHPTKCYTNSKVLAPSEKTNSEQVRLQVFCKSRGTNCQIPQVNRQLIPTAGTSNSKGSQTSIRPVARHYKIPTNGGSQSRPTWNCWTLGAKSNKVSWSETSKTFKH